MPLIEGTTDHDILAGTAQADTLSGHDGGDRAFFFAHLDARPGAIDSTYRLQLRAGMEGAVVDFRAQLDLLPAPLPKTGALLALTDTPLCDEDDDELWQSMPTDDDECFLDKLVSGWPIQHVPDRETIAELLQRAAASPGAPARWRW